MSYFLGIDSGSTTAKVVLLKNEKIVGSTVAPTGANSLKSSQKAVEQVLCETGLCNEDIAYRVSTGYGRQSVPGVEKQVTEITCHARGVKQIFPKAQAIIDIGGQDFKVIKLDNRGSVTDFRMNDKCAAGTGRFLEVMARVLELDLYSFSNLSLMAKSQIEITSICTVFAESEVINHVARGTSVEDLIYGILNSVCTRVYSLAKVLISGAEHIVFTGGVAQNVGMVKALGDKIGTDLLVPTNPQLTGALGAAVLASEYYIKEGE